MWLVSRFFRTAPPAVLLVLLMGIASLFADMTHEGARSIYGAYLPLLGASATALGFVAGLGELAGYALRLVTGIIADRTGCYWGMTLFGYAINLVAVPCLALVSEHGWIAACLLLLLERTGKAIRQPARNTLLSFAASRMGAGKTFALHEFLDQVGAFLGPVLLFGVLYAQRQAAPLEALAACFAVLVVPAALTMLVLLYARHRFPCPERLEPPKSRQTCVPERYFILYLAACGLFALGFMDFPLVTLHLAATYGVPERSLPLFYALAMIADAFAALLFGWLYDRFRFLVLLLAGGLSAFCAVFLFCSDSLPWLLVGIVLWGAGMGAQESVFKAAVVTLCPCGGRSTAFGLFECCFGLCWFAGSWLMGWLYERDPFQLALFSVGAQLCALPLYAMLHRRSAASSAGNR